ncbi:MAG: hemolysin family protein [Myxococcales bacterium]|nr:hemolysin family protein [Myxococcales bacterium]
MRDIINQALAIVACLACSAMFSACETAVTSLGRAKTTRLIEAGGKTGRAMKRWSERPSEVLISILICNNIVNITASAVATSLSQAALQSANFLPPWLDPVAVAVGVMTLLLLTFGEITPKTLARDNAESVAPALMYLMGPFFFVSRPLTLIFSWFTDRVSSATSGGTDSFLVKEEDIEHMVRLARQDGSLNIEREKLLRTVFEFTETMAREVMVPRTDIQFIAADTPLDDLIQRIIGGAHSRMPVFEGSTDNVIGICYARDMLKFVRGYDHSQAFDLRKHLRPPKFVAETKPISRLLSEMQQQRVHLSIVVDEFGGVAGLVTLEDIIEQFFGDIQDEFDREDEWVQKMPDGSMRIDARLNFGDFLETIGIDTHPDDEDFDTVGGFVATRLGVIDAPGESFVEFDHLFTVVESSPRRIRWVRVEPVTNTDADRTASTGAVPSL